MKRWYWIGGALLLVAGGLCAALLLYRANPAQAAEAKVQAVLAERNRAGELPVGNLVSPGALEVEKYESPVDFPALWEMNPDVCAWLYIPDTQVNYPILQREEDDSFYLNHNSAGGYDERGAIFTESAYNSQNFTDPVTVVYGHYMRSGNMFGSLQSLYSGENGLAEHGEVIVYLPDRELHYQVFAGVPFSMRHILYYNDFSDPEVFQVFLEQVYSVRSINASIDETLQVSAGDQLLILSTCLRGDSTQRYLVLAKQTGGNPAP